MMTEMNAKSKTRAPSTAGGSGSGSPLDGVESGEDGIDKLKLYREVCAAIQQKCDVLLRFSVVPIAFVKPPLTRPPSLTRAGSSDSVKGTEMSASQKAAHDTILAWQLNKGHDDGLASASGDHRSDLVWNRVTSLLLDFSTDVDAVCYEFEFRRRCAVLRFVGVEAFQRLMDTFHTSSALREILAEVPLMLLSVPSAAKRGIPADCDDFISAAAVGPRLVLRDSLFGLLRQIVISLDQPSLLSVPLLLAGLNALSVRFTPDVVSLLLRLDVFSVLRRALQSVGDARTRVDTPTSNQAPRIGIWAFLDALTTAMLQMQSAGGRSSANNAASSSLQPVFDIVCSELGYLVDQVKHNNALAMLHGHLDKLKQVGDGESPPVKLDKKKKSKEKPVVVSLPTGASHFSLGVATANKLTSATEFGVLQPQVDAAPDDSNLADEPRFRHDAFAVKILSILVKLLSLPSGPGHLTASTAGASHHSSAVLCLTRLAVAATPRVRCLACQALKFVLPSICDNELALAGIDAELGEDVERVAAPGEGLSQYFLQYLGRTVAAPLLSALTLSTTACIRKTEELEALLLDQCRFAYTEAVGQGVWIALCDMLATVCKTPSLLARAVQHSLTSELQVCLLSLNSRFYGGWQAHHAPGVHRGSPKS